MLVPESKNIDKENTTCISQCFPGSEMGWSGCNHQRAGQPSFRDLPTQFCMQTERQPWENGGGWCCGDVLSMRKAPGMKTNRDQVATFDTFAALSLRDGGTCSGDTGERHLRREGSLRKELHTCLYLGVWEDTSSSNPSLSPRGTSPIAPCGLLAPPLSLS